jgi:ClpP class serine protease
VNFVAKHSSIDPDELLSYMNRTDVLANDIGSIVDGNEAVRLGLIDEVGGLSEAIRYLKGEK